MDLLDQRINPSDAGDKYVIILVEVFYCYTWARAIKAKDPTTVVATLAPMLEGIQGEARTMPVISSFRGESRSS